MLKRLISGDSVLYLHINTKDYEEDYLTTVTVSIYIQSDSMSTTT